MGTDKLQSQGTIGEEWITRYDRSILPDVPLRNSRRFGGASADLAQLATR
jgi:hypothetical protein